MNIIEGIVAGIGIICVSIVCLAYVMAKYQQK